AGAECYVWPDEGEVPEGDPALAEKSALRNRDGRSLAEGGEPSTGRGGGGDPACLADPAPGCQHGPVAEFGPQSSLRHADTVGDGALRRRTRVREAQVREARVREARVRGARVRGARVRVGNGLSYRLGVIRRPQTLDCCTK